MKTYFQYPFLIGMIFLFAYLIYIYVRWYTKLSKYDKVRFRKFWGTKKVWKAIYDSINDGLLHASIFKKNPVLGYMHMSLAFGWFLLIVIGHLEVVVAKGGLNFPFYYAIFFRYFEPVHATTIAKIFAAVMDFLLLFILVGVALAITKRFYKKIFGMKHTTKLKTLDKVALYSLWAIFPLRLLAESCSAAVYQNGSFLTNTTGAWLGNIANSPAIYQGSWWLYSFALCFFFIALPFSRYMHIPTEIYYIFLRNAGIKTKKNWESYAQIQLYSCSRCGVCLDACQLYDAGISDVQSVYFLQFIRNKVDAEKPLFGCLICGRCQVECPVHLNLNDLRTALRIKASKPLTFSYSYTQKPEQQSADTIYFAGCMTHLTPGTKKSMTKIFDYVGEKVWFMDEDKSICCGRPLMLAGQYDSAAQLIEKNTELIKESGAKNLILSCPYCYKVFKEDYILPDINIKFHANYIKELIDQKKLPESKLNITAIYHDPCELGRGMNIYQEPRDVIEHYSHRIPLQKSKDKDKALCCGAGLGGINLTGDAKNIMTHNAMTYFDKFNPDVLVTACPLCKKTFVSDRRIEVLDIAELVVKAIEQPNELKALSHKEKSYAIS